LCASACTIEPITTTRTFTDTLPLALPIRSSFPPKTARYAAFREGSIASFATPFSFATAEPIFVFVPSTKRKNLTVGDPTDPASSARSVTECPNSTVEALGVRRSDVAPFVTVTTRSGLVAGSCVPSPAHVAQYAKSPPPGGATSTE